MPSKKRIILLFGILTIGAIVGAFLSFLVLHTGTDTYTVTRMNIGFEPGVLQIKKGSRVVFVNESDFNMWPASDSHPEHSEYPVSDETSCFGSAFDACTEFQNGESWEFTFTETGYWPYHDHLSPGIRGIVIVVDEGESASQISASPRDTSIDEATIREFKPPTKLGFYKMDDEEQFKMIEIYSKKSAADAWGFLKEIGLDESAPKGLRAHQFGHIIGNELYHQFGSEGFLICDKSFVYACNHGIIEEAVVQEGVGSLNHIVKVCEVEARSDIQKNGSGQFCFHGIGHGLVTINNLDLGTSLKHCDSLLQEGEDRRSCYRGVFMEYVETSPLLEFDPDNPWDVCLALDDSYQSACGHSMPAILSKVIPENAKRGFPQECLDAPTDILRRPCVHMSGKAVSNGPIIPLSIINDMCNSVESPYREECLAATALGYYRNTYGGDTEAYRDFGKDICALMGNGKLEDLCLGAIRSEPDDMLEFLLTWREM